MRTEERRTRASTSLEQNHRLRLGQFFTPREAADLIAGLPRLPAGEALRVLDPGAGAGSLTAAIIARIIRDGLARVVELVVVEVDSTVLPHLEQTIDDCVEVAAMNDVVVKPTILNADLFNAISGLGQEHEALSNLFDLVIMNPPYRKLGTNAPERQALASQGIDCSNLYSGFIAVGVLSLRPMGELVAITPRSFANGPYFGGFRRFFLTRMALDRIHTFESRSTVFGDAAVLQENVVISATRRGLTNEVLLSISKGHRDAIIRRAVDYDSVVVPGDPNQFIRILTGDDDLRVSEIIAGLPCAVHEVPLEVSTGKVVDFRAREHLLAWPDEAALPLIYPGNVRGGRVQWPLSLRKPQALAKEPQVEKLLMPHDRYVLVKRFSSKEERRRVVAALYEPNDFDDRSVGFENHLNVFHVAGRGLGRNLATGLSIWLNSTVVDRFFRTFSGHTQVNATDLRSLRYPGRAQLEELGCAAGFGLLPDQEKIDALVQMHIIAPNERAVV